MSTCSQMVINAAVECAIQIKCAISEEKEESICSARTNGEELNEFCTSEYLSSTYGKCSLYSCCNDLLMSSNNICFWPAK